MNNVNTTQMITGLITLVLFLGMVNGVLNPVWFFLSTPVCWIVCKVSYNRQKAKA